MRTTLTLDADVAVEIERLRRERDASLKDVVNDTLRDGLRAQRSVTKPRKPFRTKTFDGKTFLVPIDNAAEAIALLEGDDYK
jgi:hypothetical protein